MILNKYIIDMLKLMYKNSVSRKNQRIYLSSLGYFKAIRKMKEMKLIEVDHIDKLTREKYWRLSPKGMKVAKYIIEIEKLVGE